MNAGKRTPSHRASSAAAVALLALGFLACPASSTGGETTGALLDTQPFKDYWFAGKAELTRYELEQARYGEIRRGDAVLIFVTEDFLPGKQVKADSSDRSKTGALPVMKLNLMKTFNTGIYPYSMMTSIFTPLDVDSHPGTLKTSTTAQEWCGHTYLQLNLRDGGYRVQGNSYFEAEADQTFMLEAAWLEDEIWTRIRAAPATLPVGRIEIIPGGQQSRLRHRPPAVETANASLERSAEGVYTYTLDYPESRRTLSIQFRESFPHEILGWEEAYRSGFGTSAKRLTTRAVRTHSVQLDYWTRNRNADLPLRKELGLD